MSCFHPSDFCMQVTLCPLLPSQLSSTSLFAMDPPTISVTSLFLQEMPLAWLNLFQMPEWPFPPIYPQTRSNPLSLGNIPQSSGQIYLPHPIPQHFAPQFCPQHWKREEDKILNSCSWRVLRQVRDAMEHERGKGLHGALFGEGWRRRA